MVVALADADRRQAVQNLAESEARARLVLDSAHDAFIGMDSDGRIVRWNAQAASTFGWSRDEVIGQQLADTIIPPGSAPRTSRACAGFTRAVKRRS